MNLTIISLSTHYIAHYIYISDSAVKWFKIENICRGIDIDIYIENINESIKNVKSIQQ